MVRTSAPAPTPRTVALLLPTETYRAAPFLEAAASLGVEIVVATEHSPPLAAEMEDRLVTVDFERPEAAAARIAALGERVRIDAVVGVDDQGVLTAAHAGSCSGSPTTLPARWLPPATRPNSAVCSRHGVFPSLRSGWHRRRPTSRGSPPNSVFRAC
ncbi:MAG: hypothetical protein R2698_12195 [Microthrixaceae bacterium]